jgi:hypothetical protein
VAGFQSDQAVQLSISVTARSEYAESPVILRSISAGIQKNRQCKQKVESGDAFTMLGASELHDAQEASSLAVTQSCLRDFSPCYSHKAVKPV